MSSLRPLGLRLETLDYLRRRGIKVGIVTRNCEEAVRRVFPDIDAFCDAFVSRDAVKRVKPHPDHLTFVMKALRISGEKNKASRIVAMSFCEPRS